MELKDVKIGIGHYYTHAHTGRKCYIRAVDAGDGACLIAELFDEEGEDICGELVATEACFLTPVPHSKAINIIMDVADPQSPVFVEIENDAGVSISIGVHTSLTGGLANIRISAEDILSHLGIPE